MLPQITSQQAFRIGPPKSLHLNLQVAVRTPAATGKQITGRSTIGIALGFAAQIPLRFTTRLTLGATPGTVPGTVRRVIRKASFPAISK